MQLGPQFRLCSSSEHLPTPDELSLKQNSCTPVTVISTKVPAQTHCKPNQRWVTETTVTQHFISTPYYHVSDIYFPKKNWLQATLWDLGPISGCVYTHYTVIIGSRGFSPKCVCHKMSVSSHRSKSNFPVKVRKYINRNEILYWASEHLHWRSGQEAADCFLLLLQDVTLHSWLMSCNPTVWAQGHI